MTGFVVAAWATRIPAVQQRLSLSPGRLAVAVLGLEGGALVGLPAGGAIVTRFGSRRSLRLGFAVCPTALLAAALAPGLGWLAAGLAVMAAANSVIDVAMNVQGIELERRYRRPILSGLHAAHPLGMLAGGLAGTGDAAADVSLGAHFAMAGGVGLLGGIAATPWLAAEHRQPGQPRLARPGGRLLLLGVVAFCVFLLDGAANNWSAAQLRGAHGASPALAAAAFTAFTAALALGRLAGDRLIGRFGRTRVVRAGGLVAAAGGAVTVAAPGALPALAGWAVLGAGLAALAPAVLGAAPGLSRAPAPVAVATVTVLGYLGSFTGPPLVGALAELTGLSRALGLLVVAGAAVALLAGRALEPCSPGPIARRRGWNPGRVAIPSRVRFAPSVVTGGAAMSNTDPSSFAGLTALVDDRSNEELTAAVEEQEGGTAVVLEKVFNGMRSTFNPEKAAGQQAVVQYEIGAPGGSQEWNMRIADGRCEVEPGRAESPRVTLKISVADFLRLLTGKANGMQLFMTGKLKVSGDLFFAQTYQAWFDRPAG
ncbi:MAG TPA: MFS transporter [Actinomycetes bacterium]|nr:MFS transporter [Actinomycetes bacterium]